MFPLSFEMYQHNWITFFSRVSHTLLPILWLFFSCPHLVLVTLCRVGRGHPLVITVRTLPCLPPGCFSDLRCGSILPHPQLSFLFLLKSSLLKSILCLAFISKAERRNGAVMAVFVICGALKIHHRWWGSKCCCCSLNMAFTFLCNRKGSWYFTF